MQDANVTCYTQPLGGSFYTLQCDNVICYIQPLGGIAPGLVICYTLLRYTYTSSAKASFSEVVLHLAMWYCGMLHLTPWDAVTPCDMIM